MIFVFSSMHSISSLPTELHDLIKSFLPVPDQVKFFYFRKSKYGSRLVEGKVQVEEAFKKAIAMNKAAIVEHLLKSYPTLDPSMHQNEAIRIAAENGHVEVVRLLLADPRTDSSEKDSSAFRFASSNGHLEVVKLLLAHPKANPTAGDNYAIRWASSKGHLEVVKFLLADSRVNPSTARNYAIREALLNGHCEVVKLLQADPRTEPNPIAILKASRIGSPGSLGIVKYLLADERANPCVRDDDGNNAIGLASQYGHVEIVKTLLADGRIDPSANDNYAIMKAFMNGHGEVVKILQADPRVFMKAVESGDFGYIKSTLSDRSCDLSNYYHAAHEMASRKGHMKIVKRLKKALEKSHQCSVLTIREMPLIYQVHLLGVESSMIAGPSNVNNEMIISPVGIVADDFEVEEDDSNGKIPMQESRKRKKME